VYPELRNSPDPITPPRAIITRWRALIARRNCRCGAGCAVEGSEGRFMDVLAFVLGADAADTRGRREPE
jgi:hypothetical protein